MIERPLLNPVERKCVVSSISLLRRMRRAAVQEKNSSDKSLQASESGERYTHEKSPQKVLEDSEVLGETTAAFLIARIHKEARQAEFEEMTETITLMKSFYHAYRPATVIRAPADLSASLIEVFLLGLANNQDVAFQNFISATNLTGCQSFEEFIDKDVCVISPLSTDYAIAAMYRNYMSNLVSSKSFRLKPAALPPMYTPESKQEPVILSSEPDGTPAFRGQNEIALMFDGMRGWGITRKVLYDAVSKAYPDAKVYPPPKGI